ncbi:hypothetical protein I4F81_006841 [Pyropia yezoensis]|uniref:Uncharacterized protein n=1 Tax=Pyropia yezoensis TaxID=2788 RepID=A0ACC3C285_PYRYE|nr:hypothetical protein I4F81_006841 [Neopyropia yezoensis]
MAGTPAWPAAAATTGVTAPPPFPPPSSSPGAFSAAAPPPRTAAPVGDAAAGAAAGATMAGAAAAAVAPPPPPPQVLVLDAGALIGGSENLLTLGGLKEVLSGPAEPAAAAAAAAGSSTGGGGGAPLAPSATLWTSRLRSADAAFYTVAEVGAEARDARARRHWELLRPWVTVRVASPRAMTAVTTFARATGDLPALSLTDLRVLALAVDLEWARGGVLRPSPAGVDVVSRMVVVNPWGGGRRGRRHDDGSGGEDAVENGDDGGGDDGDEAGGGEDDGWTTVTSRKGRARGGGKRGRGRGGGGGAAVPHVTEAAAAPGVSDAAAEAAPVAAVDGNGDVGASGAAHGAAPAVASPATDLPVAEAAAGVDRDDVSDGGADDNDGASHVGGGGAGVAVTDTLPPSVSDTGGPAGSDSDWDDGPVSDPDDDGTGWIHPENLPDCLARDGLGATTAPAATPAWRRRRPPPPPGSVPVGIVTTDFAMQNVALQMGLRLLSVDGRRPVTAVRRHVLRCTPCGLLTRETGRRFCGRCGHAALIRLPYTVTADGVAVVAFDPHRRVSTRGTKYPIPRPKGGRAGHAGGDLVFAEDVAALRAVAAKHSARPRGSVGLGEGDKYNPGAVLVAAQRVRVGYGRRNVNAVRPGGGNRKKK